MNREVGEKFFTRSEVVEAKAAKVMLNRHACSWRCDGENPFCFCSSEPRHTTQRKPHHQTKRERDVHTQQQCPAWRGGIHVVGREESSMPPCHTQKCALLLTREESASRDVVQRDICCRNAVYSVGSRKPNRPPPPQRWKNAKAQE